MARFLPPATGRWILPRTARPGLPGCSPPAADLPHLDATRDAAARFQRAHIPFGGVSRRQLDALHRFRAIVLPNVLRDQDREEIEAFRAYVEDGQQAVREPLLYTSLVEDRGTRHRDFMLADV